MFLLAWGGNHFTPLVHMYEEDGGYAVWQANLLLGMYVGGLIPGLLVASALSDRRGRKPILVAGMIAAIVGSVLLGLGFDLFWLLCVGRVLAGDRRRCRDVGGYELDQGTLLHRRLTTRPESPPALAARH